MIHELAFRSSAPGHRRLAYCVAISTLAIALVLAVLEWPAYREADEAGPLVLDLVPAQERPKPLQKSVEESDTRDDRLDDATERQFEDAATPEAEAQPAATDPDVAAAPPAPHDAAPRRAIDWQVSLERASAETVEAHSKVDSLHPAFDELRRIAAVKYAEPRTGKPPPIWENAEKDIYGRTLLRHGNCFRVLDDTNVGNRYAFETFEQYLVFCDMFVKGRQEFPWIETIVARYAYLREPDGGLAAED